MKMADMKPGKSKGKDGSMPGWADEEGPRVRINHDQMQKLGLKRPPATGDEYHLQGHGRVVGSREEPRADGKSEPIHSIDLVIHHMGIEPKSTKQSVRDAVDEAADAVKVRRGESKLEKNA